MSYVGRFAPSPTGALHLGTARSALIAWIRARQQGGRFLLRCDDLDGPRVRPGAWEAMLEDLAWLGLDWDAAPLKQSERESAYAEALEALRSKGLVYGCSCSRKELAAIASAPHSEEPAYPGLCRKAPQDPGRPLALRFLNEAPPAFEDLYAGPQPGAAGDFVIRRSDGLFSYQLATVVDDAFSGVTEVLRGDDLLPSASRQLALFRALALPEPRYAHLPLMKGEDGQRLAKRDGAASIAELRAQKKSPDEVSGLLCASMGLVPEGTVASASELAERLVLFK